MQEYKLSFDKLVFYQSMLHLFLFLQENMTYINYYLFTFIIILKIRLISYLISFFKTQKAHLTRAKCAKYINSILGYYALKYLS